MRRDMKPGDGVTVTLAGETKEFPPERVTVSVDETTDRGGKVRYRYATLVVDLAGGEFPEDLSRHIERTREG